MTKKEINEFKKEVKNATGLKIKDIKEIVMVSETKIEYGYYQSNYDRVIGKMTYKTVDR